MTEKVILHDNHDCILQIKGEHIDLGSSYEQLRNEFISFCDNHKYHPTTASIIVAKTNHEFAIKIHIHLKHKDYHSHAEDNDIHKIMKTAFHMLQNNISKDK